MSNYLPSNSSCLEVLFRPYLEGIEQFTLASDNSTAWNGRVLHFVNGVLLSIPILNLIISVALHTFFSSPNQPTPEVLPTHEEEIPPEERFIKIRTLEGITRKIRFDPEEKAWEFSKRLETVFPHSLVDDGNSNRMGLLCKGKPINSFANRLEKMGTLVPESTKEIFAVHWDMRMGANDLEWQGNASSYGVDREVCAICLESLERISNGRTDNPFIPSVLKCKHAFHLGCLNPGFLVPYTDGTTRVIKPDPTSQHQIKSCPSCRKSTART